MPFISRLPATTASYSSYNSYDCSGLASYTFNMSIGTCSVMNNGTSGQYYQKAACTALFPTPKPTARPSGPSFSPSTRPSPRPSTATPTLPSIRTGYLVSTGYGDTSCSTVQSLAVYVLGACVVQGYNYSYVLSNYMPSDGYANFSITWFSDRACRQRVDASIQSQSYGSCGEGYSFAYSATPPTLPTSAGVIMTYVAVDLKHTLTSSRYFLELP